MNREILFRGKDASLGEWVYGWYTEYPYGRWPLEPTIVPKEEAEGGYYTHTRVNPETVGQYTGQTDKNGKRIFEGDILEFADNGGAESRFVVGMHDSGTWVAQWTGGDGYFTVSIVCPIMVVVGNIHDNPELLEVAE